MLLVSNNINEYENILQHYRFMRVHNSFLINLLEVKKYVRTEGGYIVMNDDTQVSLSPSRKEEFLKQMAI